MKDPEDVKALKDFHNERTANFKNNLSRYQVPVYQILAGVPVNANDGMHNPDFIQLDKKEKQADFVYRTPQKVNTRFKHVPPSVAETLQSTYESRIKAKRNASQQFNSLNLFEKRFFAMRNHNDLGKHVPDKTLEKRIMHITKDPEYGKENNALTSGRLAGKRNNESKRGSASVPHSSAANTLTKMNTGGDSPAVPGELAQTRIKKRGSKVNLRTVGHRQLKDEFSERMAMIIETAPKHEHEKLNFKP